MPDRSYAGSSPAMPVRSYAASSPAMPDRSYAGSSPAMPPDVRQGFALPSRKEKKGLSPSYGLGPGRSPQFISRADGGAKPRRTAGGVAGKIPITFW